MLISLSLASILDGNDYVRENGDKQELKESSSVPISEKVRQQVNISIN